MTSKRSSDNFFDASTERPDSLGPKPTSSHNVLIRGNTPAHGLGEPVHVDAELSKGDRTATIRTKKMLSAIKDGAQQVGHQQRRLIVGATIVLLFSMVFLAGSTLAVVYTRETHVDADHVLVDSHGEEIGTVEVQSSYSFAELVRSMSAETALSTMALLMGWNLWFTDDDGFDLTFTVSGTRMNASAPHTFELFTMSGHRLLVESLTDGPISIRVTDVLGGSSATNITLPVSNNGRRQLVRDGDGKITRGDSKVWGPTKHPAKPVLTSTYQKARERSGLDTLGL